MYSGASEAIFCLGGGHGKSLTFHRQHSTLKFDLLYDFEKCMGRPTPRPPSSDDPLIIMFEFEWRYYALSTSNYAIFRARTYSHNITYSVR